MVVRSPDTSVDPGVLVPAGPGPPAPGLWWRERTSPLTLPCSRGLCRGQVCPVACRPSSCGSTSPEDLRHGRGVGRASVGGRVRGTRCWLAGRHSQRPPRDPFAVPLCAPHGLSAPRRPQHGEYVPGAPGPSPLCAPATGWLHRLLLALALASLQPRDFVPINDRNKGRPLVPTDHPGSPASSRRRARPAALPQTRPRCGPAAGQGILSEVTGPWWRAERRPPTDVDAP